MRTPFHPVRTHRAQVFQLPLLATLCAGLWCAAPCAAQGPIGLRPTASAANTSPDNSVPPPAASGSKSAGPDLRRLAIGSALALGLWSAWRTQATEAAPPVAIPAAPPVLVGDADWPIDMDGITDSTQLRNYSIRRLMDTLRQLRANKKVDCDHGRSAMDYFCAKLRIVKEALKAHGVTEYGDESNDGCACR